MTSTGTLDGVVHLHDSRHVRRRRRLLYTASTTVFTALVALALVDAVAPFGVYGVDSSHARASGGGFDLDVRYGSVSRPALATPFDIEVTRQGGFDGPVTLAVSSAYLAMWDENGLDPEPTETSADGDRTYWTFDPPPDGDTLNVSFDARIEPAVQRAQSGAVAVLDEAGAPAVEVTFTTWIWP